MADYYRTFLVKNWDKKYSNLDKKYSTVVFYVFARKRGVKTIPHITLKYVCDIRLLRNGNKYLAFVSNAFYLNL